MNAITNRTAIKNNADIEQPQEQLSEEDIQRQSTEDTFADTIVDNQEEIAGRNKYKEIPKRSPARRLLWFILYLLFLLGAIVLMVFIIAVIYSYVALAWADEVTEVPPIDKGLAANYHNWNGTRGEILIVGAGASGLFAGYTLKFLGIPFTILEASDRWGGRVQRTDDFADVPLDLGAEWIHTNPRILQDLLLSEEDQRKAAEIEIIGFQPQSLSFVSSMDRRVRRDWGRFFYKEYKFESTTWSQWLEEFVVPYVQDNIVYNAAVQEVDYSSSSGPVTATTRDGSTYTGDKAILAVPMKILQDRDITFTPSFPSDKRKALRELIWAPGGKMFIEFEEAFYTDFTTTVTLPDFLAADQWDLSLFFNAVFRKSLSSRNIMGILQVGEHARIWDTASDKELFEEMMAQLVDAIYDGKASKYYVKHQVQNWSQNPFVRGTYLFDGDTDSIEKAVGNKVFFAIDSDSMVQSAGLGGRRAAVEAISSYSLKE